MHTPRCEEPIAVLCDAIWCVLICMICFHVLHRACGSKFVMFSVEGYWNFKKVQIPIFCDSTKNLKELCKSTIL
jgi:hypothetical protein